MIEISFVVVDALGDIAPAELPSVTEARIATELFQCYLTFHVNGTDLSWKQPVPMIAFARSMFMSAKALRPERPEAEFISIDFVPWWKFRLVGSRVLISRDDRPEVAQCELAELLHATAQFGVDVYDALLAVVPAARNSTTLSRWYPYEEMKDRA